MKGGKPGLNVRRKGALARLEATYEAFKKQVKTGESDYGKDYSLRSGNRTHGA